MLSVSPMLLGFGCLARCYSNTYQVPGYSLSCQGQSGSWSGEWEIRCGNWCENAMHTVQSWEDKLTLVISRPKPSCTSLFHTVGLKIVVSISEIRDTWVCRAIINICSTLHHIINGHMTHRHYNTFLFVYSSETCPESMVKSTASLTNRLVSHKRKNWFTIPPGMHKVSIGPTAHWK